MAGDFPVERGDGAQAEDDPDRAEHEEGFDAGAGLSSAGSTQTDPEQRRPDSMALAAAGEKRTAIELRDITMDDLPFYEQLLLDPAMMAELGGPLPRAGLSDKLRGIVRDVEGGRIWYFTITPEGDPNPAGTVCIWDHPWNGKLINEIGWMIAPGSQGRGLASQAVRSVLAKARAEQRWDVVHAFPGITNGPSNAICRKAGFSKLEEVDFEYAGRPLRCNHWRIDLRGAR